MLEQRGLFEAGLAGRRFAFSLLAHADHSSPMLDFLASSSVLQVRCDCPPPHLLDFLCSAAGLSAHAAAAAVAGGREEEEALLGAVRDALGAKHVIRVCSSYDQDKVAAAARRLLECAPAIRAAGVDLAGASLAIDDCYELWDSGGRGRAPDDVLQRSYSAVAESAGCRRRLAQPCACSMAALLSHCCPFLLQASFPVRTTFHCQICSPSCRPCLAVVAVVATATAVAALARRLAL